MINSVLFLYICSSCLCEKSIDNIHEQSQAIINEWREVDEDGYPQEYTLCLVYWNNMEIQAVWWEHSNLWYIPCVDLLVDPKEVEHYLVLRKPNS